MKITIVSYFCPPEVSAPASRVHENAARFVKMGHEVTILTGLPNHPRGKIFDGYRWRPIQREMMDGVRVVRVGSWPAPNTTTLKRLRAYLSLTIAQIVGGLFTGSADVVIGTSPPLFTPFAGYVVSLFKRCPFVLEVRDLWPENMIAIGAISSGFAVGLLRRLESLLYRKADLVVPVTQGFGRYIHAKGVPDSRIAVIPNGFAGSCGEPAPYPESLASELGVEQQFVAAYIGTVGINHGIRTLLDAGERLKEDADIVLLVVGDGAERRQLEAEAEERGLRNVKFVGERPRSEMAAFHALSDVMLVLLKKAEYFRLVIPSKIFVAMGFAKPVLIGVEGESRDIIEAAGGGLGIEPENPDAVVEGIRQLRDLKKEDRLSLMGSAGREYVLDKFDRDKLAEEYCAILTNLLTKDETMEAS